MPNKVKFKILLIFQKKGQNHTFCYKYKYSSLILLCFIILCKKHYQILKFYFQFLRVNSKSIYDIILYYIFSFPPHIFNFLILI